MSVVIEELREIGYFYGGFDLYAGYYPSLIMQFSSGRHPTPIIASALGQQVMAFTDQDRTEARRCRQCLGNIHCSPQYTQPATSANTVYVAEPAPDDRESLVTIAHSPLGLALTPLTASKFR